MSSGPRKDDIKYRRPSKSGWVRIIVDRPDGVGEQDIQWNTWSDTREGSIILGGPGIYHEIILSYDDNGKYMVAFTKRVVVIK